MHHPGPPRFVAAGEELELAPRDPDPDAEYSWEIVQTPEESAASVGSRPVEHFVPDVPGTYVARLTAPDGEYDLTIRALPGELSPAATHQSGVSGMRSASGSAIKPVSGESGPRVSGSGSGVRDVEGVDGEAGRPRLTLEPIVEDDHVVVRAIPNAHPRGSETADDLTVEFLLDDRDEVDRDAIEIGDREVRVPRSALEDELRVHAVAVGEGGYSVPDVVSFVRENGTITTAQPYHPPAWAEDSVIYEIYVRTFGEPAEGESAFDVIVDRLEYLDSLGVDVLWLTPVLENDHAPHGYNITDFFSIADDLGDRDDYERFIETAHDRGMKVLFDLVCNHSARTHPHFQAAVSNPDSEYRDWYEWREGNEPETYFEWEHIANFNFDHLPVRRHLLDAVDTWSPLVDGFRCDMAWAVPNGFWRELHDRLKARDSEFLLLDETIPYIPDFQAGLFDMHFDSTTYFTLRQIGLGEDADELLEAIENRVEIGFPDHAGFMLYSENHDETRYIVDCGRDAAKAALGAIFTLPGSPMVYAGQEFGQRGRRDDLAWEHADADLQAHVGKLADVRHDQPPLQTDAALERLEYEVETGEPDRVVAYTRTIGAESVAVVLNFGEGSATVEVSGVAGDTDLVSGEVVAEGAHVDVESVAVLPADPTIGS